MRTELTSEPGDPQQPNEDYASIALPASGHGGTLVVLDGVTPPQGDDGCVHGVPWFTARLGGAMLELSGSRHDLTLAECLTEAIARTADAHRSTCDLSHARTPQSTVVAARWSPDTVEHLVLSDSALLLETTDDEPHPGDTAAGPGRRRVRAVLDQRLAELPPYVRALGSEVRSLPEGSPERARARAEYVRAVESLRNAPDGSGFHTAAADPAVASLAVTGTTARTDVTALLALTDGATRWNEVFHEGGWQELFGLVRARGTGELLRRVREAEAADPDGVTYPRGKRSDDATAAFAEL